MTTISDTDFRIPVEILVDAYTEQVSRGIRGICMVNVAIPSKAVAKKMKEHAEKAGVVAIISEARLGEEIHYQLIICDPRREADA